MCAFHPNAQQRLVTIDGFDPVDSMAKALRSRQGAPWDNITDFITHPSFCGITKVYPRQRTLQKLIFLETENMTDYDLEVIEGWRQGFMRRRDVFGVQPDIWERIEYLKARGARRFPHIQYVGGRRGSKGFNGGILGAEQIAYLYSLDDWQTYYGVDAGKDGYLQIGATSQTQAKAQLFADVRSVVERCAYLQPHIAETKDYMLSVRTPADIRRIAEMRAANVPIDHLVATIKAQALSATSAAFRGATAFGLFLDEFAFMVETGSSKSGDAIYEDASPSLDQFDLDSLTYIPSSPYQKIGKCFSLYQEGSVLMQSYVDSDGIGEQARAELQALAAQRGDDTAEVKANPTMLVIQLPSWGLYQDWERAPELIGVSFKRPIQPGLDHESQRRRQLRNPEKFRVERMAQWAEVVGAYFDEGKVEAMFKPLAWRPPLEAQSRGYLKHKYRIHCDPGRTGANFAMCIGHEELVCATCEWTPEKSGMTHPANGCLKNQVRPHVIIDFLHVWRPQDFPPDVETGRPTIDYVQVREEIEGVLRRFPSTSRASFDQWNSAGLIADLRKKFSPGIRVTEVTFTEKENQARFEKVKSALNLGWVSSYRDSFFEDGGSLLEMELKFLSEKNGRVVKQDIGPVTTKDLSDCLCVVVSDLLHDALERYGADGSMAVGSAGSTDVAGLRSGRELERVASLGSANPNKARQAMANLSRDRRNTYVPSRAGSIYARRGN